MVKLKKNRRGAPGKKESDKTVPYGLTNEQVKRLKEEAEIRGITFAAMKRIAVEWFLTALDTKRGDVDASAAFDDSYKTKEELTVIKTIA